MTDHQKLKLAAKARGQPSHIKYNGDNDVMACKLRISTLINIDCVYCFSGCHGSGKIMHNNTDEDVCRAVREARLLVAAEIGRVK